MRVFLSWSRPTSRAVAVALHDWLPNVIQEVDPWMSATDITPGVRWAQEIGTVLEASNFGVLCLTPANLTAPWVLFEAGALSKRLDTARVVPLLFGVKREDVTGPLSQFHNVEADHDGVRSLVGSIFNTLPKPSLLSAERLDRSFEKWWPELEAKFAKINSADDTLPTAPAPQRDDSDVLSELLNIVRGLQRDVAGISKSRTGFSQPRYGRPAGEARTSFFRDRAAQDSKVGAGMSASIFASLDAFSRLHYDAAYGSLSHEAKQRVFSDWLARETDQVVRQRTLGFEDIETEAEKVSEPPTAGE